MLTKLIPQSALAGLFVALGTLSAAEDENKTKPFHEYEYVSVNCQLTEEPFYHFEIVQRPETVSFPIDLMRPQTRVAADISVLEKDRDTVVEAINGWIVHRGGLVRYENDPNQDQSNSKFSVEIRYSLLLDEPNFVFRIDDRRYTGFCDDLIEVQY